MQIDRKIEEEREGEMQKDVGVKITSPAYPDQGAWNK